MGESVEMELVSCPECGAPAEVVDRFTLPSTGRPVEMVKVACVTRHWFLVPVEKLPAGSREEAGRWARR
jgi:hypothetical protein